MLRGKGRALRDISLVRPKLLSSAPEELEHCRIRGSPFSRSGNSDFGLLSNFTNVSGEPKHSFIAIVEFEQAGVA
ncbi:hypothetical protein D3C71_1878300 [compost metagenome]